ncbi:MAG TPA: PriCT-2 domain-containing protein, partial [Ginsengibacter sp.]|nr:PriCT-2 domain-containing protein [Ginsengibacter sp.]
MAKKVFKPSDWLEQPKQKIAEPVIQLPIVVSDNEQIEQVIQEIEAKRLDIATAYADWRDIGFAFADAFGESGRDYFHRISCFYDDYTPTDCNEQYDKCLKANGTGITLATLFFHAKQAGIKLAPPSQSQDAPPEVLPTFGQQVYDNLPDFLKSVIGIATSDEEKDILILGSIVSLSA